MPVISPPRRYSSTTTAATSTGGSSNSYLPPTVGGHNNTNSSLFGKNLTSSSSSALSSISPSRYYRSSSLCNNTNNNNCSSTYNNNNNNNNSTILPSSYSSSYSTSGYSTYIPSSYSSYSSRSSYNRPSSIYSSSSSYLKSGGTSGGTTSSLLLPSSSSSLYRNYNSYLTGGNINNNDTTSTSSSNRFGIRNTSIRSALPSSPTLSSSRNWDRDRKSSTSTTSSVLTTRKFPDTNNDDSTSPLSTSIKTYSNNITDSYDKSTKIEGLCGLRNIGNTCFMNSVIQCLSHTKELTKFLKTQTTVRSTTKDQQILSEFAKLIRGMWSQNVHSLTPSELKSAFSSKHRMYSSYNQQDAQEFLRFFLDSLHCALNSGTKGDTLKLDDSLSDNAKADKTWEWYTKVENSVIKDLFVGQLKSTLKCTTCGNTSVTFDPFWDLSVPLPSSSRCKLDSCLDLFIREEILDGDEMPTCSKCKTRRKCTKSFTIQRFPKYLVIHLKRFSETRWSKLSNVVEFPIGEKELNMAPYASNPSTNVLYTLYAISNHMGSTAGGHYVALCKHPVTKKWHEFNDNIVSDDLSESVLVSSSAYLLFYERAN